MLATMDYLKLVSLTMHRASVAKEKSLTLRIMIEHESDFHLALYITTVVYI